MKIICIGRNYADHVKELGNEIPETPVIFVKPDSAVLRKNNPFYYPEFSKDIHYEVELIVKINATGKSIPKKFASNYYSEIGLGIDFTARDIQQKCKEKGLPWERAKAFDQSAVISEFVNKSEFEDLNDLNFSLKQNNTIVQEGNTKDMLHNIDSIIENVTQFMTVKKGDLIFTGTPKGVGSISIGDHFEGYIESQKFFDFQIK